MSIKKDIHTFIVYFISVMVEDIFTVENVLGVQLPAEHPGGTKGSSHFHAGK